MKIAVASDHVGIPMKIEIIALLRKLGHSVEDFGAHDSDRADYPAYGQRASRAVANGQVDRGVVICGTGIGISIASNKVPGVRCVVCTEPYSAVLSRNHNDTNVLALGARVVGMELAKMIVAMWLDAAFEGGRHQRRINQLDLISAGGVVEDQVDPLIR